jgi:hypothetical protein
LPSQRFQSGNKFAKGGKREGAGDKTKEEKAFKLKVQSAVEVEVDKQLSKLAKHYTQAAMKDNKVLMHLMDAYISKAKTEVEVSGVKTFRVIAPKYMHEKE